MRRSGVLLLAGALACGLAPAAARGADAPPPPLVLQAPALVDGVRTVDVDGDRVVDLVLSSGREVRVWRGGTLAAAPTWTFAVPPEATFVTVHGAGAAARGKGPTLLAIAGERVLRLAPGQPAVALEGVSAAVPWTDHRRATMSDFAPQGGLLLPTASGFRWIPDLEGAPGRAFDIEAPPARRVQPAGPFLEDSGVAIATWPSPWFGTAEPTNGSGAAVWIASDDALRSFRVVEGTVEARAIPSSFLPRENWQRTVLEDLDADGAPDLAHEASTNDSGTYVYFHTPCVEEGDDLRPPRATIRLRGFQIPPEYTDLDGDGRPDVVITSIDIDGSNVIAAISRGRVVARTRAFLNRSERSKEWFPATPDAEVESEIGVRILFTYAGAIDVKRSFTILPTADLDGDGRKDLVIRTGDDRLAVRLGRAEGVWSKEATTIAIPAVGRSPDVEGRAADLTGDRRDDIVLLYRAGPGETDRVVVVTGR
ncbi:MAG TPA: VCBS repeat-containing protein [Planctomycetota bacterium]|nr:VCBS repeat-containing protein [Planctomycetota bacterium]